MSSIFLKKIAPPAQSPPAGIGAMTGILIKDHDFLKNHLKIGKTKTGTGDNFLRKIVGHGRKTGQGKKGTGSDFFKNRGTRSGTGTGKDGATFRI